LVLVLGEQRVLFWIGFVTSILSTTITLTLGASIAIGLPFAVEAVELYLPRAFGSVGVFCSGMSLLQLNAAWWFYGSNYVEAKAKSCVIGSRRIVGEGGEER